MNPNLISLKQAYDEDKIVPFIGAGLSIPFEIPSWNDLIKEICATYSTGNLEILLPTAVQWHLNENDYWGAIDEIKKYTFLTDQDLQKQIVRLINERKKHLSDDTEHNYSDLAKLKCKLFLTTNYENLLYEHFDCDTVPILLKELDFSSQDIFDTRRICHLHGYTSNPGSIVISKSSYDSLYTDEKYGDILKVITSNKHVLFLGFSFDDKFVSNLILDYKKHLQGIHYILLNNPSQERIRELREKYGLITIPYDSTNSSHTTEIRKILDVLTNNEPSLKIEFPKGTEKSTAKETTFLGAGLSDLKENLSDHLFYKKLKLESIDEDNIELSTLFYIASEKYIRFLRNEGISLDVIDMLLGKVFIKYREKYVVVYKKYGNSEEFLNVVHESLEALDLGRYTDLLKDKESDENESRGLIHLLAEDDSLDVWWGKGRFNEQISK
ncbi:SIR2 family protein [Lysinibacillus capsici]|uniref:SIR2 family NAD-dependent protein deacylase n=1 Tax=Lysinibacillus capsici TaxID=2115968 RepID=UPI0032E37E0D